MRSCNYAHLRPNLAALEQVSLIRPAHANGDVDSACAPNGEFCLGHPQRSCGTNEFLRAVGQRDVCPGSYRPRRNIQDGRLRLILPVAGKADLRLKIFRLARYCPVVLGSDLSIVRAAILGADWNGAVIN